MSSSSNYPPGVTGREPEIAGFEDPLDQGDIAVVIAKLCTVDEKAKILDRLALLNGGRTEGIEVADALDIMYDSDAMLSKVEAAFGTYGEHVGEWNPAHAMTVYVLSMLGIAADRVTIREFLARRFDEVEPDEGSVGAAIFGADYSGEDEPERIRFTKAGSLIVGAQFFGDRDASLEGVEVVACGKCCALIPDDTDHSNREQHAMAAHGCEAVR